MVKKALRDTWNNVGLRYRKAVTEAQNISAPMTSYETVLLTLDQPWAKEVIHAVDPEYDGNAQTYQASVSTVMGVVLNRAHKEKVESVTIALAYFNAPEDAWRLIETKAIGLNSRK